MHNKKFDSSSGIISNRKEVITIQEIHWPKGVDGSVHVEVLRQLLKGAIELEGSISDAYLKGLVDGLMVTQAATSKKWRSLSSQEFELLGAEIFKSLQELVEMLMSEEGH